MKLLQFVWERVIKGSISTVFLVLIRAYQLLLSPMLGASCRYTPTCSQYAVEAIRRYGPFKGGLMAVKRISRCHPWGGHGHDPVP